MMFNFFKHLSCKEENSASCFHVSLVQFDWQAKEDQWLSDEMHAKDCMMIYRHLNSFMQNNLKKPFGNRSLLHVNKIPNIKYVIKFHTLRTSIMYALFRQTQVKVCSHCIQFAIGVFACCF